MRDMEAREQLPAELKASNALIMTVGQSKGLEFDDVFLVDFCADSPAGMAVLQHLVLPVASHICLQPLVLPCTFLCSSAQPFDRLHGSMRLSSYFVPC